ncbi:MAG: AAA family ATPase [Acidimicrobiia bacterium]
MRFTVRPGTDPFAAADATLLSAMGLPGGGVISLGSTHAVSRPAEVVESVAILVGPETMSNAGVHAGQAVDAKRALLPSAEIVTIAGEHLDLDPRSMIHALQSRPVTAGDTVTVDASYADGDPTPVQVRVLTVTPSPAGMVTAATRFVAEGARPPQPAQVPAAAVPEQPVPNTSPVLTGLEQELEMLTSWLTLLTSPADLPSAWGLPRVAGVLLDGPTGCGKSELVVEAAQGAGATVTTINLNLVFKPETLLNTLERAVKGASGPSVLYVDRVEAVAGDEGLAPYRTQVAAILRWFLDAVAERPTVACVLGVTSASTLGKAVTDSGLLPRTLTIPPPDLTRRRLLFEAATARVPSEKLDFDLLATRTAGFSGADITAAVVHASALSMRRGGKLTTGLLLDAVESTVPSLGSASLGEVPSYGFEKVANLSEVKQRLTEAVIWPITDPDRFQKLGIDPPRGVLLYGPPGTGKTFVVRALAHEAGAAFFPIKGAELLDKFVGESERGVREVFARARAAAPSILFFDELDALAPVRGRSTTSVTDSVVAALLTEMDGVMSRGDVSVIGATNRVDLIDPALLRSGRFEVHLELGLPGAEARRALLGLSDVPFAEDVDLDELARRTEGLSFADLSGMLREAALTVLREGKTELKVGWPELEAALARR